MLVNQNLGNPWSKKDLIIIKSILKGFTAEIQYQNKQAKKLTGIKRHYKHLRIRSLSSEARHYYIAYAFLRGLPYSSVEKNSALVYSPGTFSDQRIVSTEIGLGKLERIVQRYISINLTKLFQGPKPYATNTDVLAAWIKGEIKIFLTPQEFAAKQEEFKKKNNAKKAA